MQRWTSERLNGERAVILRNYLRGRNIPYSVEKYDKSIFYSVFVSERQRIILDNLTNKLKEEK